MNKFIVIGGKMADLLTKAMKEEGAMGTERNVEVMCGKIWEMLECTSPEIFVLYGLDKVVFYGTGDDGIKFPFRDSNGIITHVEGEARILGHHSY